MQAGGRTARQGLRGAARWALGALVLGLAGLLSAGCGGADASKAKLRLVNASTGYAALDLYVDDQRVQRDVVYGASASYAEVDPNKTDTKIARAGSSAALFSSTPALARGDRYSLVAYGADGALRAVLLDDNASEPDRGEAWLRVLNAAPEAGPVDVYLTPAETALADAAPLVAGAAAGATTAFAIADATSWRLRVTAAGDKDDLRLDLPAIALASRQVATLVVTPGAGGVLVNALLATQDGPITTLTGTQARVRAVAAVTDSGAVGASVGGVTLMAGTGAPAVGAYRLVPASAAAAATVSVNGVELAMLETDLAAGTDHTLLVWGPAAAPSAGWIADDNQPATVAGRAKLRLVHGLAGLGGTLSLTVDFSPLAEGVLPGTASPSAALDATALAALTVTSPGRASPVFSAVEQTLAAGSVYSLFVVGGIDAPVGILRKDR